MSFNTSCEDYGLYLQNIWGGNDETGELSTIDASAIRQSPSPPKKKLKMTFKLNGVDKKK